MEIYAAESGNFTATLAGDAMLTRRLSVYDEPAYMELVELFRKSDVGFANCEAVVRRWDEGAANITTGTYSTTTPDLLQDMKWMGLNLLSYANNHSYDYGEAGVLSTIRHVAEAGIVGGGSGANLAFARAPSYLDTPNGRVGMVATTAMFRPWNKASPQRSDLPGRPGINPLGFKTQYQVDSKAFDEFRRASEELGFAQARERAKAHFFSDKELGAELADEIEIFGARVTRGSQFSQSAVVNKEDLEQNLKSIREARRQSDWVIFSLHYHELGGKSMKTAKTKTAIEEPADFIIEVAHAAIDAGADIVAGHGAHFPLGIEIYKGKPIFYNLGNFIFENDTIPYFPQEAYERFDLGPDATASDFNDARTNGGKKGHPASAGYWENTIAKCVFAKGALSHIDVYPISQGFGKPRAQRGRPVIAKGEVAGRILERMARLSKLYGTNLKISGDKAVIQVR